ncbi:hypothetical protein DFP72DRAFT_954761 [Ephemerocybe angulata]|uniref:Senescence domain-containing protein n=1 Tax=Ephemerocybe angulata TaxID=980116 RepID=A0A8H6MHA6_9AGAR|nr:hypothetical protein DFP72DRAFT_954761 [Tulosesus angulatus]
MSVSPEAFALLVLSDATLSTGAMLESGYLALECVTITHPGGHSSTDRDVYLVLRLNTTETPLDPDRVVQRSDSPGYRNYIFRGTPNDPAELTLSFKLPANGTNPTYFEDLDTFEGIIGQYHGEVRGATTGQSTPSLSPSYPQEKAATKGSKITIGGTTQNDQDLRGHLVMVDEKTGEVVGQVEDRFRIQEDPTMHTRGHENDPVVIEVSEEAQSNEESDANAMAAFARIVPPEEANWITNSASVVSSAISLTTNLVVTTITAASNFYVNHSKPSPHHSAAATPAGEQPPTLGKGPAPPLPPRPRALVFLTSETTKKNLNKVHAVSGEAVKVSAKTVGFIDGLIRKAMGAKPKRERPAFFGPAAGQAPSSGAASPSYAQYQPGEKSAGLNPPAYGSRPGTPSGSGSASAPPPLPPRKPLTNKDRILISADLILSTIDHSTRQLLDASTQQVGKVMHHKYGAEAAESSMLMANTARNVGLVYVDARGIGRRALLKRAGRQFVKARFSSRDPGVTGQGPTPAAPASGANTPLHK